MEKNTERRSYIRKEYTSTEKPVLKIGKIEFEVIDISERGMRFINNKKVNIQGWVSGTLILVDNRSIEIDGIIVRKQDSEVGMHLVGPIDI